MTEMQKTDPITFVLDDTQRQALERVAAESQLLFVGCRVADNLAASFLPENCPFVPANCPFDDTRK